MEYSQRKARSKNAAEADEASAVESRTLVEVCEPFFNEVCGLIRRASFTGEGRVPPIFKARQRLLDLLAAAGAEAEGNGVKEDFDRIEPVLAFFADDLIMNSKLPFASEWRDQRLLASEARIAIVAGQLVFFQELDAALLEPSAAASERLAIFHTCLGLGFCGMHRGDAEKLRTYSNRILGMLNTQVVSKPAAVKVCPHAYENTDTRPTFRPVSDKLQFIGVALVALLLAVVVVYAGFAWTARSEIKNSLEPIHQLESKK